ncbi:hypothetical protein PSE10B_53150 [Pseudomonas amygdali pv. eriobotryae]|uniref:hypothetical protein n=1 Tax=Pseudomonas syringae group TaxID=136849 RepID=UPI00167847A5|nr:hypothetical protein [Pseudomonas amygdali]GFZ68793.1 hypothetical protein PSE10B_53150 [Pseudomonas amygdali pv. eriobotryae]
MMKHFYYFAFMQTPDGKGQQYTSAVIGLDIPKVTQSVIQQAKSVAGTDAGSFMLSCSYLGEMTSEEHRS